MSDGLDVHAARRTQLLTPVAQLCTRAGVAVGFGDVAPEYGPVVRALRAVADDGSWDVIVTVVRAHPVPAGVGATDQRFTRDPQVGYDLDSPGDLVYEVQITEDDDGLGGHGARPLVSYRLLDEPEPVADELILWVRRAALFHCEVPPVDPNAHRRRERRNHEHRLAAAAAAKVDVGAVPNEAADDVAAVDAPALCWHFPRERGGRYQRSAVVALASYGGVRPHQRGRWLTARADGDRLVLGGDDLIGVNQKHRWDDTPWLWDRRQASTPRQVRWQVSRPAEAAPAFAAMRRGDVADALRRCGVATDEQLTKLLAGAPTRYSRAELTATWVANLYRGLADAAPWRLAAAYQIWRERRTALGLPARDPVPLVPLGGLGTARKPKVALDSTEDGPILRLHYTGGNAILPRALWTVPADLMAELYGWPAPEVNA